MAGGSCNNNGSDGVSSTFIKWFLVGGGGGLIDAIEGRKRDVVVRGDRRCLHLLWSQPPPPLALCTPQKQKERERERVVGGEVGRV